MTLEYYTVVYRVEGDNSVHDAWWQAIQPLFMADEGLTSVISVSKADEVTRLDCIRRAIKATRLSNSKTVEAIGHLLDSPDPLAWWRENGGGDT